MKLKSIVAAAFSAAALMLLAQAVPAEAAKKPIAPKYMAAKIRCIPGHMNPMCDPHPHVKPWPHYHYWWYWDYPPYYWQPWPHYGFYHTDAVHHGLSCSGARSFLAWKGYKSLAAIDCKGTYYVFTGLKNGHKYRLTINRYTREYSRKPVH